MIWVKTGWVAGVLFHDFPAIGPVFDEPGEEGGDIDFVAEHLLTAFLPLVFDAGS